MRGLGASVAEDVQRGLALGVPLQLHLRVPGTQETDFSLAIGHVFVVVDGEMQRGGLSVVADGRRLGVQSQQELHHLDGAVSNCRVQGQPSTVIERLYLVDVRVRGKLGWCVAWVLVGIENVAHC